MPKEWRELCFEADCAETSSWERCDETYVDRLWRATGFADKVYVPQPLAQSAAYGFMLLSFDPFCSGLLILGMVAPKINRKVYSFGLFVADMIYKQNQKDRFPDTFLGVRRRAGNNKMKFVPEKWIRQAVIRLKEMTSIRTSFGGLANAMASILAALGDDVALVAPYGQDRPGKNNVAYLSRMGVDTRFMELLQGKISATNLIRNLQKGVDERGKPKYAKDYALYLAPLEGYRYSKWLEATPIQKGDIVHLGGMDLILCPKKEKLPKYKIAIEEMLAVARYANEKGATVVGDFCNGDEKFWKMVPDEFFKLVNVAKPSHSQAIPIYNSRHKEKIELIDPDDAEHLLEKNREKLLKLQNFLHELGVGAVFMTLDVGGTIISASETSVFGKVFPKHIPILPVRKFVDGTGCGDAYVAGIIHGLRRGWGMETVAWFSSVIGSLIAERPGVSLKKQYIGKGKWLAAVEARAKGETFRSARLGCLVGIFGTTSEPLLDALVMLAAVGMAAAKGAKSSKENKPLLGKRVRAVDSKLRVILPVEFRNLIGPEPYIVINRKEKGVIRIYPVALFLAMAAKLAKNKRDELCANSDSILIDTCGRLSFPAEERGREWGKIFNFKTKEVTFVGQWDHIKMLDKREPPLQAAARRLHGIIFPLITGEPVFDALLGAGMLLVGITAASNSREYKYMRHKLEEITRGQTTDTQPMGIFTLIREYARQELRKDFSDDKADLALLKINDEIVAGEILQDPPERRVLEALLVRQASGYFDLVNGFGTIQIDAERDQISDLIPREEAHEDALFASTQAIDTLNRMRAVMSVPQLINIARRGLEKHKAAVDLEIMGAQLHNCLFSQF
ncbi:MAG: PfkB family carbohydrate kinase [Candidatus Omnitrophica bacterium]|nr:PfkB family carbohydrate kinase [Candidatus Omnitrophota bacterium]